MKNGQIWLDDQGNRIQAHGGMITQFDGKWYWYGENKGAPNTPGEKQVDAIGVSCYSSDDLRSWHYEGLALAADSSAPQLTPQSVMERPKVLYNPKTKKYVLFFHSDSREYNVARVGFAVSDTPIGPFKFLYAKQAGGYNRLDSRDMTVYVDQDNIPWVIHSANWNKTLYFSRLTEDYLDFTGESHPTLIDQEREAPTILFRNGMYYSVTSGCTGWAPNSALYATSRTITSWWKLIDNPCSGPGARQTFGGQSTHLFEKDGQAYLMLDHWKPDDLQNSGYSILPVYIDGLYMEIPWVDTIFEE